MEEMVPRNLGGGDPGERDPPLGDPPESSPAPCRSLNIFSYRCLTRLAGAMSSSDSCM